MSSLVTLYNSKTDVQNTVRQLADAGFYRDQISIISQNDVLRAPEPLSIQGMARQGLSVGRVIGGVIGAGLGLLLGYPGAINDHYTGVILLGTLGGIALGALGGLMIGTFVGYVMLHGQDDKTDAYVLVVNGSEDDLALARTVLSPEGWAGS
jgi:hypothetical protein